MNRPPLDRSAAALVALAIGGYLLAAWTIFGCWAEWMAR